jgi:hypothetical protein
MSWARDERTSGDGRVRALPRWILLEQKAAYSHENDTFFRAGERTGGREKDSNVSVAGSSSLSSSLPA